MARNSRAEGPDTHSPHCHFQRKGGKPSTPFIGFIPADKIEGILRSGTFLHYFRPRI